VLFWSTVATAFKLTLRGMNNAQLLFYSSLTSLIVFFFFALKNSRNELKQFFKKQHIRKNTVLGFINPFVYYLVLFKAYSILPAQEAQPVNLTWPLILSILSVMFLKQKLPARTIIGLLISFVGVVVIATRGNVFSLQFHNLFGVLLALGSSFIWSVFWILNLLDKREESIKLFGAFFFGTIYTGIYIFFFDSFGPIERKFMVGAVYIGLFEMGITFFLWLKALSLSEDKAKTSTMVYLFPVISLSFITLIVGEKLYASSIAGLALILSGILFQQVNIFKKKFISADPTSS
jgi:drug/metabolite transporter (DMT)-like permease